MRNPFIVFGQPDIRETEIAEVEACLRSKWLGTGPRVAQFESSFASYKGVSPDQVAAVNSCEHAPRHVVIRRRAVRLTMAATRSAQSVACQRTSMPSDIKIYH